ncbi:MAG: hypothetical protein WDO56_08150 [Gammaproteobacteria bacterium]
MQPAEEESSSRRVPRPVPLRRSLRLGIGGRLALGLAAVAAVILVGHTLATETTRKAVAAVREMQQQHEPLARRAGVIVEKLVGYDRAVSEYMQRARAPDEASIIAAHQQLDAALAAYFEGEPRPVVTPSVSELQVNMAGHVSRGKALATEAAQRADWVARRNQALANIQNRVVSRAAAAFVSIRTRCLRAARSLSLPPAATALRSGTGTTTSGPREEKEFASVLARHADELLKSPGKAWMDLIREDFSSAVHLRESIGKFDETNGPSRRAFLDEAQR